MQPTLNGIAPSWSDIGFTINVLGGQTIDAVIDIAGANWESKVERGEQRGASGGRVIKRTKGSKTDTADAEFYRSGFRELLRVLVAVAPKDDSGRAQVSQVTFDVAIKFSIEGETEIYETRLRGCHLDKMAGKLAEGNDPDKVSVDLNPIEIVEMIDGEEVVLL